MPLQCSEAGRQREGWIKQGEKKKGKLLSPGGQCSASNEEPKCFLTFGGCSMCLASAGPNATAITSEHALTQIRTMHKTEISKMH